MSFSQRHQTILSDLGKTQAIHRDLKELLDFYENLFRAQFVFKSQLRVSGKVEDLAKEEVNLTIQKEGCQEAYQGELPRRREKGLRRRRIFPPNLPSSPFSSLKMLCSGIRHIPISFSVTPTN